VTILSLEWLAEVQKIFSNVANSLSLNFEIHVILIFSKYDSFHSISVVFEFEEFCMCTVFKQFFIVILYLTSKKDLNALQHLLQHFEHVWDWFSESGA
jgi:hypothetical protein